MVVGVVVGEAPGAVATAGVVAPATGGVVGVAEGVTLGVVPGVVAEAVGFGGVTGVVVAVLAGEVVASSFLPVQPVRETADTRRVIKVSEQVIDLA